MAINADNRFSEASLERFAASLSLGALAPRVVLANNLATAPTEMSYENDPRPTAGGLSQLSPQEAPAGNSKVDFRKAPNPAAALVAAPPVGPLRWKPPEALTWALDCHDGGLLRSRFRKP